MTTHPTVDAEGLDARLSHRPQHAPHVGQSTTGPQDAIRSLVIVGAGPKALAALAFLEAELALVDGKAARANTPDTDGSGSTTPDSTAPDGRPPWRAPVTVTLCDPAAELGAGTVWRTDQPEHLRMNVNAGIVDLRCPSVPLDFTDWERREHPDDHGFRYPPRARVGRYLAWAGARLRESPWLQIEQLRARVTRLDPGPTGFIVERSAPTQTGTPTERRLVAREVLLCTGHSDGGGIDHERVVDASLPGAAGREVHVIGAALTAFDVVLDLTEGRGGRFTRDSLGDDQPTSVRYHPGGDEPESIVLHSRSGLFMLPKPETNMDEFRAAARAVTVGGLTDTQPDDRWWTVLADAAVAGAAALGVAVQRDGLLARLDQDAPEPDLLGRLRADLRRAHGDLDDDPAWWWGRVWSSTYPEIIGSLERAPRDPELWRRWRDRATRLERWAFGPPALTMAKLLALFDRGTLRLERGPAPDGPALWAITAPPGVREPPEAPTDPLWSSLVASGLVHVRDGERGVLTRPDAECVADNGMRGTRLAAIGRPTEDPVIGHDTLNRTLHSDARRWAAAFAQRAARQTEHPHQHQHQHQASESTPKGPAHD